MSRTASSPTIALVALCFIGFGCSDSSTGPDVEPAASADLRIMKTAADDGSPAVGETVTYTLRVSNAGPDAAIQIQVRDSLPEGVSFVSASDEGTESEGVVSWATLPSLASGAEVTFSVTATLTAAGSVTNTAVVASITPDPSITNNRAIVQTGVEVAADVSVTVSSGVEESPALSDTLTYTLTIANTGPSPAQALVVTDTLPDGVAFSSASASGTEFEGVVRWDTIPYLAAGADTALTVVVTILSGGALTNTAAVRATTPDPDSENNTHTSEIVAVGASIFPDTGPPGTVIRIGGLDLTGVEIDDLRVYLGGEEAPVRANETGHLHAGIPLFLDSDGESSPPADPVDLVVKVREREVVRERGAVTVLPLVQAPGEAQAVADKLHQISSSLQTIMTSFGLQVGEEERYFMAMFAALDSLIHGSDEASLASALEQVQSSTSQTEILDGLLKTLTASDHLGELAAELQAIAAQAQGVAAQIQGGSTGQLQSRSASVPPSLAALQVGDRLLALKMQFYVLLGDFGEEVIGKTNQQFSEWIGTLAGVAGIAKGVPQVDITLVILAYIDFVVNKLIVGLLPSTLDAIDLHLQTNELETHQKTNATIAVSASNTPPGISLQYIIGNVLTFLGASGKSEWVADFTEALVRTASFYLAMMRGVIATYAADHPELNMDPDLFSFVPEIRWQAQATTPAFYDLKTFTPNIVGPLADELNWETKDEAGIGRIYVMPSSSQNARLLSGYYGGAFGNESVASQVRSILVGSNLELEVEGPNALDPDESGEVRIRAGYREQGGVNWTSGINISIQVDGGSIAPASGATNSTGYFTSTVEASDSDAEVIRLVIVAKGENQTFAGRTLEVTVGRTPPVVRVRASHVDDRAIIYVNGASVVDVRWGEGEGGVYIGHKPGDSGWVDVSDLVNRGDNEFRFWLWNKAVCCGVSATFEIEVDGAVVVTRVFQKADSTEGVKYTETIILTL